MEKLDIQQLRKIQIAILDDVDEFCKKTGITYSLCGGTMLGAVRHKGYIPWDDDIDLMMPRTDYDRFIREYSSNDNILMDLSSVEYCNEQFLKISRKGTCMEDATLHRRLWGVNIDIFPIDGLPDDYVAYTDNLCHIHNDILVNCPIYKAAGRHRAYWHMRHLFKTMRAGERINVLSLKREINLIVREHLPENCPLSTVIVGDFKIYPFPSSMFFDITDIQFEGKLYSCIKDTDTYLGTVYGDYLTLPPIEKRVSHHHYDAYLI